MANLIGSICLSDIPKEFIKIGKNGKKYLSLFIGERRQPSQYGNSTHFIKICVPLERKQEGVDYFIGDARVTGERAQEQRSITASAAAYDREREMRQSQPQPLLTPPAYDEDGDLPF